MDAGKVALPFLVRMPCSSALDLLIWFCRGTRTLHRIGWLLCLMRRTG